MRRTVSEGSQNKGTSLYSVFLLSLDDHVTDTCKKASKPLAVLKRLGISG